MAGGLKKLKFEDCSGGECLSMARKNIVLSFFIIYLYSYSLKERWPGRYLKQL